MKPDVALILCRFLFDGAALFLWGASAYLSALVPAELARWTDRRLGAPIRVAVILLAATTAVLLPVRAAAIGEGWPDALSPELLQSMLLETSIGQAWIVQAVLTALLLVVMFASPARYRLGGRALCAGLLLAGLTISGHAAMNDGWLRTVHRLNDAVHLLAAGAWIGALAPVLVILHGLNDEQRQRDARVALMRFSTAGHVAVALALLSGAVNTFLIVGGFPLDWSLDYQRLLCIKLALVALMIALALANRYIFVPRLARGRSLTALAWATRAEIFLSFCIVALVAWFGTLQPI